MCSFDQPGIYRAMSQSVEDPSRDILDSGLAQTHRDCGSNGYQDLVSRPNNRIRWNCEDSLPTTPTVPRNPNTIDEPVSEPYGKGTDVGILGQGLQQSGRRDFVGRFAECLDESGNCDVSGYGLGLGDQLLI